jgi:hypothetical protein
VIAVFGAGKMLEQLALKTATFHSPWNCRLQAIAP